MAINGVIMQYFQWYIPAELNLWNQAKNKAKELADAGFTALWLPPANKGMNGINDVGYAVYDMYDLREFDQRDSVRTRYGNRQQYLEAINSLHNEGIQVYVDAVLNHRMGGDDVEIARAIPFPNNDRLHPKGSVREIKDYTWFAFPARKNKYSDFDWHWWHFDAVDYDDYTKESGTVYLFEGKAFDDCVALENGNFAYLMGCDIDYQNQEVRNEVIRWGKWYLDTTGAEGFRLDAIKHISAWFFPQWIDALEQHVGRDLFVVGD